MESRHSMERGLTRRRVSRRRNLLTFCEPLEGRQLLSAGPRQMEYLDRGVVATRASSSSAFISWRSLAQDPASMTFNVYRSINGAAATKIASSLTGGTNYTDSSANNAAANYTYTIKPVIGGVEQSTGVGSYTVPANTASGPLLMQMPLRNIGNYGAGHISVADLDGDGKYDYIVDRYPLSQVNEVSTEPNIIEAYKSDGTFLWSINAGSNSFDQDNIEPGSTTIDTGNWDGVTAYDLDGDGKAEVFYRTANGVVFGDGTTLSNPSNNDVQFMSVINGQTGAEKARIQIPTDFLSDGPLAASLGIGYLDGVHPSLVAKLKNRVGNTYFNQMFVAWDYNGTSITQKWKYKTAPVDSDNGHNIRIVDVNGDGKDEIADTAQVINGDGTLLYNMRNGSPSIGHGDRFYIGDFDPNRPGLEGYGIQQNNPNFMTEYYYDAGTGQVLHSHYLSSINDNGRGIVSDIDPNYAGYEYWSFYGLWTSNTTTPGQAPVETELNTDAGVAPYPNFNIWWDGDVGGEGLNNTHIDDYDPTSHTTSRETTIYHYGSPVAAAREAPLFYGDILGDWREEVIFENSDHQSIDIYTTQYSSTTRIYSLAQDPEYRNGMTVKGYLQSNMLDYYLGYGMSTPPTPNITMLPQGSSDSNAAPTVATPAAASRLTVADANPISLSVLGADDSGEANLSYTWWPTGGSTAGSGVSFSSNGTNAAKNTIASFTAAGTYNLMVTIRDAAGKTATSSIIVNVLQTLSGVAVTPTTASMVVSTTQQFSATGLDQFGDAMSGSTFGWLVTSGSGTIGSSGLYTAPSATGTATVQAQAGSLYASATVTITPIVDTYQAESATFGGGVSIDTNNSGYDGTGFANFPGNGGFVQWNNVDGGAGGSTNILFRFALATGSRTGRLTVNGAAQNITFNATGAFNQWTVISVPVTLTAGATNTIKLESTGQDLANVDELQVQRKTSAGSAPTIATAANSPANPVIGTSVNLGVLGADDGGEAALTYLWAATGPAVVNFSANGINAAKNSTATFSAEGTYTFAVTIRDAAGLTINSSFHVYVDLAAPTVKTASFVYDSAPNLLRLEFSEPVTIANPLSNLIITKEGGETVAANSFTYDSATNTATFGLPGPLADGNYQASFAQGSVTDLAGAAMAPGYAFNFFAFAGDANHNRTVDVDDLYILATNWFGTGKTFAQGDFNYDGVVDGKDLGILSASWQQTLAPPAPPAPPLAAAALSSRATSRAPSRTVIQLVT